MGKINILNDAGTNKLTLEFNGTSDSTINSDGLVNHDLVTVDSNGNVGIGTSSPSGTLHTKSGDGTRIPLSKFEHTNQATLTIEGQQSGYDIGSANGTLIYNNVGNLGFRTGTSGNAELLIASSGNVGIGTTTPTNKLSVAGNIGADGSIMGSNINCDIKTLGNGNNYDIDRTQKVSNGVAVYSGYNSGANRPTTYDIAVQFGVPGKGLEFAADWLSTASGTLYYRTLRDCCQNWGTWQSVTSAAVSDRRAKDNIVDYTAIEARSLIAQLNAVEYDLLNPDGTIGNIDRNNPEPGNDLIERPREIGYIAQDIQDIVPFIVEHNDMMDEPNEHGYASAYTVKYERLVPVITEALKDVYSLIDSLKTENEALKARIETLEGA